MKAFVINLERATERRRHVLRQLKRHKVDYEFVKTVDGKQLSQNELERLCDLEAARARPHKLTIGALGCALSHYNAYQEILRRNLDMALVLEDDIVLPPNFNRLLGEVEKRIAANEVVLLHYFRLDGDIPLLSTRDAEPLDKKFSLMYPVHIPLSGGAYVITREAARALSAIKLPINVEADDWTYFYNRGALQSVRCVYPIAVRTSHAETQIQPQGEREKMALRHRITKFVYDNELPLFYPLLLRYREARNSVQPLLAAEAVDEPSAIRKSANAATI